MKSRGAVKSSTIEERSYAWLVPNVKTTHRVEQSQTGRDPPPAGRRGLSRDLVVERRIFIDITRYGEIACNCMLHVHKLELTCKSEGYTKLILRAMRLSSIMHTKKCLHTLMKRFMGLGVAVALRHTIDCK